jgi:hypothetical protein
MRNEAAFANALYPKIKAERCKVQPIESGSTALGIPDAYVRTTKVGLWIELKNLIYPVVDYVLVPFRPGQYVWLRDHWKLGGISILGIASVEGFYFFYNESIQRDYDAPLAKHADFCCDRLVGRDIVRWFDSLGASGH